MQIANETVEEAARLLRTKGEVEARCYLDSEGYGLGTTRHIIRVAKQIAREKRK